MKTTNSKGNKPDIKAKQPRGESNLFRERTKTPKKAMKGFKNKSLKIDRQQILEYPKICCQLMQNLKAKKL